MTRVCDKTGELHTTAISIPTIRAVDYILTHIMATLTTEVNPSIVITTSQADLDIKTMDKVITVEVMTNISSTLTDPIPMIELIRSQVQHIRDRAHLIKVMTNTSSTIKPTNSLTEEALPSSLDTGTTTQDHTSRGAETTQATGR